MAQCESKRLAKLVQNRYTGFFVETKPGIEWVPLVNFEETGGFRVYAKISLELIDSYSHASDRSHQRGRKRRYTAGS